MCAGKPRGPTLVSIFMHAFIVARMSHVRDKTAAPALTFPIICRGGGVCACEASAGGRVSRVGARFTQERTAQLPEVSSDRLPRFYPWPPTSASRACRRYEKSPHGTMRKCGDLLPLAYLAAGTSARPPGRYEHRSVKTMDRERSAPRTLI